VGAQRPDRLLHRSQRAECPTALRLVRRRFPVEAVFRIMRQVSPTGAFHSYHTCVFLPARPS
jgi:hypothetical protein